MPRANGLFPELVDAVFELERNLIAERGLARSSSTHCAVNRNANFLPHVDSGRGAGQSMSMIYGLGDYGGGAIVVEGAEANIRYTPHEFDGWKQRHWTAAYKGERFSLVWFTPEGAAVDVGEEARRIAELYEPPLLYRPGSTDELVLREVLGSTEAYRGEWGEWSFDPLGHTVLDLGGQIGTYTVWAMERGAASVHVCEPEPSSAALLRSNVGRYGESVVVEECAVVGGATTGTEELIMGRDDQVCA